MVVKLRCPIINMYPVITDLQCRLYVGYDQAGFVFQ